MRKALGVTLSIVFISIFFSILTNIGGLRAVLISIGSTLLILAALWLCTWLLSDKKR